MVLKSLLVQGFKSFPDKTEIKFAGGLTAIVGPNGSGKSNISDAIRWVLGEQSSRSLRGAKMEDIIFGGTVRRGPVGFAEVSLILDNTERVFHSDFSEIMVTRRYYRSGESEYFLNKRHCRLKDIHEMFMDTGLGRDGYSSIGQGRIDEILSLKSEDRREIFEEAAGITKFRYRKEEAERRLAATEENLVRIRDVYAELEARREPLERQSHKAREYLRLREQLRVLEISLWLLSLQRIGQDTAQAKANQDAAARQMADACAERDALYQKADALGAQLRQAEVTMDDLRGQLRACEQRIAGHDRQRAVLQTNIENHRGNIARMEQESARTSAQEQSLETQLTTRRTHLGALDEAHAALRDAQTQQEAERQALRAELDTVQQARQHNQAAQQTLTDSKFRIELERASAQSGLDNMEKRRGTIAQDIEASESRLAAEQETQETLQTQRKACEETIEATKNKLSGARMKAENRRAKVEQLTEAHRNVLAQQTDCENRIKMLTEMQKDYEGFSRSVKRIMEQVERGAMAGIHGPVSSLIHVPDAYVTAIETALGAAAGNIVVDTPKVGRDAIGYLKRVDGGRATFLPLDTIRPHALREQGLEQARGFCGVADALVQCDARYRDVFSNLLGRTVIAEDLDAALGIANAYRNRFRIVTKDGQMIQAGGAMTGGSASKSSGVLARGAKLRALEAHQQTLLEERKTAEIALTDAKRELGALEFDRKAIEAEGARAQEDCVRLTAALTQHRALLDSLTQRSHALLLERDNLADARAQYEARIAAASADIAKQAAQLTALQSDAKAMEQRQTEQMQAQSRVDAEVARLTTELAQNRTERASEQRALEDLERLQQDMTDTLGNITATIARFQAEIETMRYDLAHAHEQEQTDHQAAEALRQRITAAAAQRMHIEGEKATAEKATQAQADSILALERELARLENRTAQLKNEEKQILDQMWERYELTPTPAAEIAQPIENVQQTEQQAAARKAEMRALGNVNLDAITEYEALMERYTFLGEQKADLEKAQHDLHQIIERLTGNMKEIFARGFAQLNTLFGETFREIFGGGQAELLLEDKNDILNCGIEIRVSPPGKALKTLTLLSGGEKAFVAIALYFAILKLRPTPFCVLDEIEAALDDVNVVRYAQYIRRLSDKTQFIVITHRRGTMEEADVLYGVTMQEQGVSKLLMLNFAEAEQRLGLKLK